VESYIARHGRLPGTVWLGSKGVPPAAFYKALAEVALVLLDGKPMPEKITLKPAKLVTEKHVAEDNPKKLWGWVIFPKGVKAPEMMDLAKRQAWALKPAILHAAK
jgi:hypothetical protein